ncbi:TPA: hypothetical protein DD449_01205 [Candidatus Berkelbacteria bacterium]|uniref:Uncharacterized protein n=1 Tax=Berkelbacteria bacterium GW2011_GWE1_39_12 TaxID=1618337 RepID=A0A0G4B5C7_9BACT|nr:MAG: hypothetical protein UT28_C0001G0846 [Berkelbacteria bacterium GW2011_GWE1_39_12]HBO60290.1 hypothetical protein [Candidatus Berkelbacteria bacterium]
MELSSIHKRMTEVENYKNENKVARETLKNELENNTQYLEASEEVKTATEKRKRIKNEILAQQETQKIIADIKENKEELDTLEEILSSEVVEYHKESNANEIEDADGDKRQFKIVVKFLPKKKNWDDRDEEGKYAAKVELDLPNLPTNGAEIESTTIEEPANS